jgi:hypothetical protein
MEKKPGSNSCFMIKFLQQARSRPFCCFLPGVPPLISYHVSFPLVSADQLIAVTIRKNDVTADPFGTQPQPSRGIFNPLGTICEAVRHI